MNNTKRKSRRFRDRIFALVGVFITQVKNYRYIRILRFIILAYIIWWLFDINNKS